MTMTKTQARHPKFKMTVHQIDGTVSVTEHLSKPSLEVLQKACGGYVQEIKRHWCSKPPARAAEIYVDEEAGIKCVPQNPHASLALGWLGDYPLLGPVVVVERIVAS